MSERNIKARQKITRNILVGTKRFHLHKSGKLWLVVGVATFAFAVSEINAQADVRTTVESSHSVAPAKSEVSIKPDNNTATSTAASSTTSSTSVSNTVADADANSSAASKVNSSNDTAVAINNNESSNTASKVIKSSNAVHKTANKAQINNTDNVQNLNVELDLDNAATLSQDGNQLVVTMIQNKSLTDEQWQVILNYAIQKHLSLRKLTNKGDTRKSVADESIASWMPDPNLRKVVADSLGGIDPDEITKEAMGNLKKLRLDGSTLDIPRNSVVDFTGLEYAGELMTLDTTYIIAQNVPTIRIADQSFISVMPNVLKKLVTSGKVKRLEIGGLGEGVAAKELTNLWEYIQRLGPTESIRVYSKDMADFSSIGIQETGLSDGLSIEFFTESQLLLPELYIEKGHVGEVFYTQDELKDFMGNSLLSSSIHSMPGVIKFLDENKHVVAHAYFEYTEDGILFEEVPEGVAYISVEFTQVPAFADGNLNGINSRSIAFSNYSLYALIPVIRYESAGDVTVHYQDEKGNKIAEDVTLSGNIGESYTSEQKTIDGYTFKEVQGETSGIFSDQAQEVTYIYTKNPAVGGNVTVHYRDENGNAISEDVVLSGNVGENYTSEQKVIDGYTFKEVKGEASGIFGDQAQEVTYVYVKDPIPGGNVTVHYRDENGNEIASDETLKGNVGETYTSEQKTIDGYTFKEVQGESNGIFSDQAKEVTYIYTKNPVLGGNVTVHYRDENGNEIASDETLKGNIGETYTSEQKTIDGYTFKEVQGESNGIFSNQTKEVTYIYTRNPVFGGSVTVHYQDENGNSISKDIVLSGNVGEDYTSEQKTIDGYTFKEIQGESNGIFNDQAQEITYIYTKNLPKDTDVDKDDDAKNDQSNPSQDKKVSESKRSINNTVKNLPKTGENQSVQLSIIGSLMITLSGFMALLLKKKHD